MRTRRMVEIGLAVGVALGFFVRGSAVQAPALEWTLSSAADRHDAFPGGNYRGVSLKNIVFRRGDFRGADLRDADFSDTELHDVDFRDARLDGARFDGTTYDRYCRWPVGFDPTLHGATLNDWPPP